MNFLFSIFFINTPHSAAAQWMAIKCIPYIKVRSQIKLQQFV